MKDKLKIKVLEEWLNNNKLIGKIPPKFINKINEKDINDLLMESEFRNVEGIADYKRELEKHVASISYSERVKTIIITAIITAVITLIITLFGKWLWALIV